MRSSIAVSATRNVMKQATSGAAITLEDVVVFERSEMQQFVGLDWATRRARWCAVTPAGAVIDEGWIAAAEGGLAMLVARLGGGGVVGCLGVMGGAAWVRGGLGPAGRAVAVARVPKAQA